MEMCLRHTVTGLALYIATVCGAAVVLTPSVFRAQTQSPTGASEMKLLGDASAEDAKSQLILANSYQTGQGASQDFDQALLWYRKAAENGDPTAQLIIGWEFYAGSEISLTPHNGVRKDPSQAATWFQKASQNAEKIDFSLVQDGPVAAKSFAISDVVHGKGSASFFLGALFEEGKDLPKDYQQAAFWYRLGAEQGNPDAQSALGALFAEGKGVSQDFSQAAYWDQKAAETGSTDAEFNLAMLYLDGHGVSQDYRLARSWLLKAAEKGVPDAQYNLGILYAKGISVQQDSPVAYFWFDVAAASARGQVQLDATKNRDLCASLLTPEQLAKVQDFATKWLKDHPSRVGHNPGN